MQSVSKKTSGRDLSSFQTILEFVTNLQDHFGAGKHPSVRPLNLYHRLISKMSFRDDELIMRHVDIFKDFCIANREQIRERNESLKTSTIEFSDRIYIDMSFIFSRADSDSKEAIWEYLLAISAYVDPENKTKELLQQLRDNADGTENKEGNFLANMIETMSSQFSSNIGEGDSAPNPMSMISSLMGSDMIGKLMGSMTDNVDNGSLDLGKLMGTMSGLISNVKKEIDKSDDPNLKQLLSLINIPTDSTPAPTTAPTPTSEPTPSQTDTVLQIPTSSESSSEPSSEPSSDKSDIV